MAWQRPCAIIVMVFLRTFTEGCSQVEDLLGTVIEMVYHHQIVLQGQVTGVAPDPTWVTAYSVNMTVQCVIKSDVDVPPAVTIQEAGMPTYNRGCH